MGSGLRPAHGVSRCEAVQQAAGALRVLFIGYLAVRCRQLHQLGFDGRDIGLDDSIKQADLEGIEMLAALTVFMTFEESQFMGQLLVALFTVPQLCLASFQCLLMRLKALVLLLNLRHQICRKLAQLFSAEVWQVRWCRHDTSVCQYRGGLAID